MSASVFRAMLADPVIQTGSLAVMGMLITRLVLRNPRGRLIGQVTFFSALTALLLYYGIEPYEAGSPAAPIFERVFIGAAKLVWWINAAWALIAFVRVFLNFEGQPRHGRLAQDLIVGLIYIGVILSVVASVFSAPVGTLIATSGVFAIILGLALQSTLSDVFSGIALNLGRAYAIGDWIKLGDGTEGRVVESNWRATHLLNGTNDLVMIPNSDLAKARVTNMSSPDRSQGVALTVRLVPSTPPASIEDVMRTVLLSCGSIQLAPEPTAKIKSLDACAAEIELSFRVADLAGVPSAKSEVLDLVYRHAVATGLRLSPPQAAPSTSLDPSRPDAATSEHRSTPLRLLDALPLFAPLTEDEKEVLAGTMVRHTFRKEDTLVEQDATLSSLMIMRSGAAVVQRREEDQEIELGRLAPGDCFGEGGLLTGAGEIGTIRALTFVVVYEIAKSGLAPLLQDRPGIAEELGETYARLGARRLSLFGPRKSPGPMSVPSLVDRIRDLFALTSP
jgi:small-conductance mechanosensitive channel